MLKTLSLLLVITLAAPAHEQTDELISPCPSVFSYEYNKTGTKLGRWYGVIEVTKVKPFDNNWLNIVLDSRAEALENWLGLVNTTDNKDFRIELRNKNPPSGFTRVRFNVQYKLENKMPQLQSIRLNDREICKADEFPPSVGIHDETITFSPELPSTVKPALVQTSTLPSAAETTSISTTNIIQNECGKVVLNVKNFNLLVVNGKRTLEGQWPWQIALYRTQVGSIAVHPEYNPTKVSRDLSILRLREAVFITDWVRPACLWPEDQVDLSAVIWKTGSVVGWGTDASGNPTEELTLVEMPVVDQETCLRSYSEFFSRYTSNYTLCAGFRDGKSVCNGDSGGGMVFKMGNLWYLRALVSLSVAKPNEAVCDPTHYVIFTDLAKFLPWIKEHIAAS